MAKRRAFGSIRKLGSDRYQVRYTHRKRQYKAPRTFTKHRQARAWLVKVEASILDGTWTPAVEEDGAGPRTLRSYSDAWLAQRPLEETTRALYRRLLDLHIYPKLGDEPVPDLKPDMIRTWHAHVGTDDGADHRTVRVHAYVLLKTILRTAVEDKLLDSNPCLIRGASTSKRARPIREAELDELETIVRHVPDKYRLLILLAAWCALRFGELAELRRADVDLKNELLRVRRSVARTSGSRWVKAPKTEAGKRDVHVPPALMPAVRAHLRDHVAIHRDALLWHAAGDPDKQLAPSTLQAVYFPAREAAGRPDLRFHDLRHTGAVYAAQEGATLKELMARLGHTSPAAALRYQHASAKRDRVIAERLSARMATVTHIDTARKEETA